MTYIIAMSGCDFFGKQKPSTSIATTPPAVAAQIAGTWSMMGVSENSSGVPDFIAQMTYIFDGVGGFQYLVTDFLSSTSGLSASGRYGFDSTGNLIAVLLSSPNDSTGTLVGSSITMNQPQVAGKVFRYTNSHGQVVQLFSNLDPSPVQLPTGAWSFAGGFGFDFVVISSNGYGIIQARDSSTNEVFLVNTYVQVQRTGQIQFFLFSNDPGNLQSSLSFDSYSLSANSLTLTVGGSTHTAQRITAP